MGRLCKLKTLARPSLMKDRQTRRRTSKDVDATSLIQGKGHESLKGPQMLELWDPWRAKVFLMSRLKRESMAQGFFMDVATP